MELKQFSAAQGRWSARTPGKSSPTLNPLSITNWSIKGLQDRLHFQHYYVFWQRRRFSHSCFAPSSPFEDTVQGTCQSANPHVASKAGKAAILFLSKTRHVMATKILPLCPFQSLCWGTGKHAAHVHSHISDLFMPLQIVPISRPLLLYSPFFLALPAQYSARDDTRPQHLSGIVGNYPSLSEVALFLDMKALRESTARGKLESSSLREHCG